MLRIKKAGLFTSLLIVGSIAYSQESYDTIPLYLKNKNIPVFELLRSDSAWFQSISIPKDTPVVIMYFNSGCHLCLQETKALSILMKKMPSVFFVMASYHDTPEDIGIFSTTYQLDSIANLRIGKDPVYAIPTFFRIRLTPSVAIYDRQQKFVKFYEGEIDTVEFEKILSGLLQHSSS